MNEKFNKNAKVEQLTNIFLSCGEEKALSLKILSWDRTNFEKTETFSNMPVKAPTRDYPFYGYSEKPPHFNHLSGRAWGYGGPILVMHTSPRSLRGTGAAL